MTLVKPQRRSRVPSRQERCQRSRRDGDRGVIHMLLSLASALTNVSHTKEPETLRQGRPLAPADHGRLPSTARPVPRAAAADGTATNSGHSNPSATGRPTHNSSATTSPRRTGLELSESTTAPARGSIRAQPKFPFLTNRTSAQKTTRASMRRTASEEAAHRRVPLPCYSFSRIAKRGSQLGAARPSSHRKRIQDDYRQSAASATPEREAPGALRLAGCCALSSYRRPPERHSLGRRSRPW